MKNNKNNLSLLSSDDKIISPWCLPEPALKKVMHYADVKSNGRMALTSNSHYTFFEPHLKAEEIIPLLTCIAHGKLAEAEAIVVAKPDFLLRKSKVTDYSDRIFEDITAFQLALWYLDRRMWTMLKKYLPEKDAKDQLFEHLYLPTKYKKNNGDYFDFDIIINPLKSYVEKFDSLSEKELIAQWCLEVGGAQTKFPAHLVQEYCYPLLLLNKKRTFEESEIAVLAHIKELEDNGFKNDYHYMKYSFAHPPQSDRYVHIPWFPLSSTNPLGKEVAITREDFYVYSERPVALGYKSATKEKAQADLDAITQLSATRKKELEILKRNYSCRVLIK